ncbi:MAG: hypothetical protein CVT67_06960 [Actinobacteria bacterium HGW-Actinobacteria-7]|nr:MAG: hypothetical protein CVT67_06960 [Actinobacteria bacterium HGW-Actinobacteria-7]
MDEIDKHEQVRVMVETDERTFRGVIHKPLKDDQFRLSDHLNEYQRRFLCLSDVTINERGQQYRAGDSHPFVAISVASITFIAPIA